MLFRRIVFFALLVGALLGALVTAVQYGQVIPLIHEAEQGRMGEGDHGPAANQPPPAGAETENHAASTSGFGPGEAGFTLLANFLTGFGFAVLMLALMIAYIRVKGSTRFTWRHGLLWGVAGFLVVYVGPALGMPPDLPGTATAPIGDRQSWWLLASGCWAVGLGAVAFAHSPWRWGALVLLAVPYVVGAPHLSPDLMAKLPQEYLEQQAQMEHSFLLATALADGIFWLALGLMAGWAVPRILAPLSWLSEEQQGNSRSKSSPLEPGGRPM